MMAALYLSNQRIYCLRVISRDKQISYSNFEVGKRRKSPAPLLPVSKVKSKMREKDHTREQKEEPSFKTRFGMVTCDFSDPLSLLISLYGEQIYGILPILPHLQILKTDFKKEGSKPSCGLVIPWLGWKLQRIFKLHAKKHRPSQAVGITEKVTITQTITSSLDWPVPMCDVEWDFQLAAIFHGAGTLRDRMEIACTQTHHLQ